MLLLVMLHSFMQTMARAKREQSIFGHSREDKV